MKRGPGTNSVLPREMNFKVFRWTKFIINVICSEQETTWSPMAGSSAPQAQSCLNILCGSRASQTLSKALKGRRETTLLAKDAPISSAGKDKEKWYTTAKVLSWVLSMQAWRPWRDGMLGGLWTLMQPTLRKTLPLPPHLWSSSTAAFLLSTFFHVTLSSQRSSNSTR